MLPQMPPELFFLFLPLAFVAFWCVTSFLLAFASGWYRLSLSYATDKPPTGEEFAGQTGTVGFVNYNRCLNIYVAREGLFVSVAWLFRLGHKSLLIPWSAIHDEESTQILWFKLTRFQIGIPSIARLRLPARVFEARRAVA
jgi:hypothetical protein